MNRRILPYLARHAAAALLLVATACETPDTDDPPAIDTATASSDTTVGSDGEAGDGELGVEDRLEETVGRLANDFPQRNSSSPQTYRDAEDYLADELLAAGYTPTLQEVPTDGEVFHNVIVEKTGTTTPSEIVIVGAHYDTARGTPGADDNASGVAATLELARRFADRSVDRTLRFILFANEEPPYFGSETMGSFVHAERARDAGEDVVAMLSLEMLGYYTDEPGSQEYAEGTELLYPDREFPDRGNFVSFVTRTSGESVVREMDRQFEAAGSVPAEWFAAPASSRGVGLSDQSSFWQNDYPGVMVTDTAFLRNSHYHTSSDTPGTLDYETFAAVVRALEPVVAARVDDG